MSITNKVLICIILVFIGILYFFSSFSLINLIASYEDLKNQELYLEFLKSENKKLVYVKEQIQNNNIDALKINVLKSGDNEHFIVFESRGKIMPQHVLQNKTLYIYLYHAVGIILCTFVIMGLMRQDQRYVENPVTKYYKGSKYNI